MNANYLARLALARLPRPYTDEVILHVFCEIERTPQPPTPLQRAYGWQAESRSVHQRQGLNQQIGMISTGNLERR